MNVLPVNEKSIQKILVILAHPDDPEFFCGATLARLAREGHEIHYCLLTSGDKGGDKDQFPAAISAQRQKEQEKAANVIGVKSIQFLQYQDGYLEPSLDLRRDIVRVIRRMRPDILITCDPTHFYPASGIGINHPDHRAAGQAVLDATYPAAGNSHYFPELVDREGLRPHTPHEVWVALAREPNLVFDVTDHWDIKIKALMEHKSQIGDPEKFLARMRLRHTETSSAEDPRYEEKFRVIKFR
jgi:LmbE family N-acetylglucosaminyl deacetylase